MTGSPLPPYARSMGMEIEELADGSRAIAMDYAERAQGRPGYFHGGVISGMLEIAAYMALKSEIAGEGPGLRLKPVNITIEFLRAAVPRRTFAQGQVIRTGRRVANVRVEAWQHDRDKLVASGWINFLLAPPKEG